LFWSIYDPRSVGIVALTYLTFSISARIEATIRKLASFGTRHTLSDPEHPNRGIGAARRWIKAELESYAKEYCGRLIVEEDSFVQPVAPRVPRPTTPVSRKLANRPRPAFYPTGLDQSAVTRAGQEIGSGEGYGTLPLHRRTSTQCSPRPGCCAMTGLGS
jgi:hypothetical protein